MEVGVAPMPARALCAARRTILMTMASVAAMLAAVASFPAQAAGAAPRTVCTITVNSADEKEAMQRHLPRGNYRFVELVERGRPDWLASACRQDIRCDMLVVSGHFNGHDFFSDRLESSEFLPVAEMERAACSNACPGLFAQLKEVYLFGCNSLNAEMPVSRAAEIERRLVKAGRPRAEAERVAHLLSDRYEESNRDFMRRVFRNVPAIYGFAHTAPVGPTAGALLGRYFQADAGRSMGTGRPNRALLGQFAAQSMTVVGGLTDADARSRYTSETCRLVDDRQTPAQKLAFVHDLLRRDASEGRMFLERIEAFLGTLDDAARTEPGYRREHDAIAQDGDARERYLQFARGIDEPGVRARMLAVAHALDWLDDAAYRDERIALIADLLGRPSITTADVGLACELGRDAALAGAPARLAPEGDGEARVEHAAVLACLGSDVDHARMLEALASPSDADVRMAEVYFHHRPIVDVAELRTAAAAIAVTERAPEATARALGTLARAHVADDDALTSLVQLFASTGSLQVQRAVAGVLLRADFRAIVTPHFATLLREHRIRSPEGEDVIDILIRRVGAARAPATVAAGTSSARPIAEIARATPGARSALVPTSGRH
jgi:hypothetical protein